MANMGRGAYEPPGDDVHIFDASEDDDVEGSRLPLLIVIALFVLAAFAGVVWLAYTQGLQRGRTDVPHIIAAEKGPARVAANGEQNSTQFKGLKIYQQPAPADADADSQSSGTPDQTVKAEPPPVAPETVLVKPPQDAAGQPDNTVSAQSPAPAATKPVSPPALKPSVPTTTAEATAPPAQLEAKPVQSAPPATSGAYLLQIGSFKSQAEADAAWKIYQSRHAATLAGRAPDIKAVNLGAKGTWYRLRVGSFADRSAAAALCAKLTAESGACFPTK